MQIRHRKTLLFLILATVVGLAVFAPKKDEPADRASKAAVQNAATSNAAVTQPPGKAAATQGAEIATALPPRAAMADAKGDLFGSQSWQPPPPKVVAAPPPPPPAPQAPVMSYRYAGRVVQDGQLRVFVAKGDAAPIAVKQGDTLDGGYVVEAITTSAITLIYPPLGHRESIAIPPMIAADGAAGQSKPSAPQR